LQEFATSFFRAFYSEEEVGDSSDMLSSVYQCHIQGGHNLNLLLLNPKNHEYIYCFHKLGFTTFDNSEKLACAVINFYYSLNAESENNGFCRGL
jgi:hypothetical protein